MINERMSCPVVSGTMSQVTRFECLSEILEWASPKYVAEYAYYSNWTGREFRDHKNAASEAGEAWQEGLDMLDAARSKVNSASLPAPRSRRRRARFDEFAGDEVCLDRLRSGAPFWRTTSRESVAGPNTITIAIDYGAGGAVNADRLVWRGIAAIALTELLEAAGYRVELIVYSTGTATYENGDGSFNSVMLKAASDPLDTVSLVNATSGWFFRVFGIGAIAKSFLGSEPTSGHGFHAEPTKPQLETYLAQRVDVKIDGVWDEFAAVELIESTMTKLERGELAAA